jgi:hypothetical protein
MVASEVFEQRRRTGFAVAISELVPSRLASITAACLSVNPDSRPNMAALRVELEKEGSLLSLGPGISVEEAAKQTNAT